MKNVGMLAAVLFLLFGGSVTLHAGKGGGKGKPGGGGGEPPADAAVAYLKGGDLVVANSDGSNESLILAADRGVNFSRPGWSPDATRLVFASNIEGRGIYTIRIDGSELTKIVAMNGSTGAARPAWSPVAAADGEQKIAFDDRPLNPDGTLGGNADIFLVNLDGSGLQNMTETPDSYEGQPSWSPDAERLALWDVGGSDVIVLDISLVSGALAITDSMNLTSDADVPGGLLNDANVRQPDWARSAGKIVVTARIGSNLADLWLVDLADPANATNLTQTPDVAEGYASWSADDTQVVFRIDAKRNSGLYVRETDGTGGAVRFAKNGAFPDWRR
jgi:TolB protein